MPKRTNRELRLGRSARTRARLQRPRARSSVTPHFLPALAPCFCWLLWRLERSNRGRFLLWKHARFYSCAHGDIVSGSNIRTIFPITPSTCRWRYFSCSLLRSGQRASPRIGTLLTRTSCCMPPMECWLLWRPRLCAEPRSLTGRQHITVYGGIVASFAIVQGVAPNGKLYWLWTSAQGGAIYGPYVNHNHYAGLMEMLTPFPLVLAAARSTDPKRRILVTGSPL